MTGKTGNLSRSKTVALIWLISAFCFLILFKMALYNSSQTLPSKSLDSLNFNTEQRLKLYNKMGRDLDEHGAAFLKHGETSQSLSLSDIFTLKDGSVTPVLKPANPPVRANVLYLSTEFSVPIAKAVKNIFNPYFDKEIWFQSSSVYHFSMFHASHHIVPVPATKEEIEAEASSVEAVAATLCPLKIVLDRVVLTSTGVLLGCWQVVFHNLIKDFISSFPFSHSLVHQNIKAVISGTDPITIRSKLKNALPHAPEKQLYDAAILHTSFARLLGPPKDKLETSNDVQFFHELVNRLNSQIRGFKLHLVHLVENFPGARHELHHGAAAEALHKLGVLVDLVLGGGIILLKDRGAVEEEGVIGDEELVNLRGVAMVKEVLALQEGLLGELLEAIVRLQFPRISRPRVSIANPPPLCRGTYSLFLSVLPLGGPLPRCANLLYELSCANLLFYFAPLFSQWLLIILSLFKPEPCSLGSLSLLRDPLNHSLSMIPLFSLLSLLLRSIPTLFPLFQVTTFFMKLVFILSGIVELLVHAEMLVSELWYVEEYDVLALALNGRMNTRKFRLGCSRG
ncbi:hypothetical protein VNO78_02876 [Psophocarpus tetragonolobus]|uniref:Uncharacterized protein n=1 Tax=Psophocarpus tetragonolobus TaxID=3891 RepID=A0AAN9T0J9_PSOTE